MAHNSEVGQEQEPTYKNLNPAEKEVAIRGEMMPYFVYIAIPIIITLIIAKIFGPSF